jgi:hypothetical protein
MGGSVPHPIPLSASVLSGMIDKSVVAKLVVVNSSRVKDGDFALAENWGIPRVRHGLLIVLSAS